MIVFKKIRWRNFLSTGDAFTEVTFDTHGTTLIVGENGAGKSTILDALSFALYGKPFRKVNKNQLLNSINKKKLEVELEFEIGKHKYHIKRGIKPNVFEVYQNDKLINLDASVGDYQDMLDKHILKINYKSFSQIVVLGSASFVPFMQLPAAARREVIEDLLDIQIFSTMNVLLKDKVTANKTALIENAHEREKLDAMMNLVQSHLDALQEDRDAQLKQKTDQLKEIKKAVKTLVETISTKQTEVDALGDVLSAQTAVQRKIQQIEKVQQEAARKKLQHKREIDFVCDNDSCPTCRQKITEEFSDAVMAEHLQGIAKIEDAEIVAAEMMRLEKEKLTEVSKRVESKAVIEQEIAQLEAQRNTHLAVAKGIKADIDRIKENTTQIVVNAEKVQEIDDDMVAANQKRETLIAERAVLEAAGVMLKDSGIKTRIIKQYIPVINKLINKYLASMDFFVNFELDENFNETIRSRFRDDFSYASFSEGEKSRLDLALLFTWRSISRLRNSVSTNLLILDEVFDGSLDSQGNEELLKIFSSLPENTNIFVISHKTDAYLDKFDRVLRFEKVKNFSRVKEI